MHFMMCLQIDVEVDSTCLRLNVGADMFLEYNGLLLHTKNQGFSFCAVLTVFCVYKYFMSIIQSAVLNNISLVLSD